MKLILKNIGKIEECSVDINGITVIGGENNTGKSTVGRALYAVFNSFYNVQKRIIDERVESIDNLLTRAIFSGTIYNFQINIRDVATYIVSHTDEYKNTEIQSLQDEIFNIIIKYNADINPISLKDINREQISQIKSILNVSDIDFLKIALRKKLNVEFNNQICNIFSEKDGEIILKIRDNDISIFVKNDGNIEIHNSYNISLHTEVVYIDDPFVLDNGKQIFLPLSDSFLNHTRHLYGKLFGQASANKENIVENVIVEDKLENIYRKLSSVCSGDIISKNLFEWGYRKKGSDKILSIQNLSSGLKSFIIIKMLLNNGVLKSNGTIILDEPEIHLHPEWQLLFAELIVLIQKELGIHILLTTHSPYFLNAIEAYSVEHKIDDRCKYYLASSEDNLAHFTDTTNCTERIYQKLAKAFQTLENMRG